MNKENSTFSLELLLLNNRLRTGAVDKDIYDQTAQKIVTTQNNKQAA